MSQGQLPEAFLLLWSPGLLYVTASSHPQGKIQDQTGQGYDNPDSPLLVNIVLAVMCIAGGLLCTSQHAHI